MKLVGIEERITEERINEVKAAVANKTMTKGAAIREMFVGGMEVKEISKALQIRYNHAYNVVRNEVLIHGLEVENEARGGEGSKKAQIIESLQAGKSITEVAKELQVMYNYVWQVGKAAGLTGKKAEDTKEAEAPKGKKRSKKQQEAEAVAV